MRFYPYQFNERCRMLGELKIQNLHPKPNEFHDFYCELFTCSYKMLIYVLHEEITQL